VGALIEAIEVARPSIERRSIKRRFARGKKRVADEGFSWVGRRPFGLEYTPGGQHKHRWGKREDEVPHVERMFTLAKDGFSHETIAKMFNADGVPTTRGGKWWGSTVRAIITNPRYKGEFPIGRYQTVRASGRPPNGCRPCSTPSARS
jgi:DNA invertase Pin-like site-specific DNA recombinase